MQGTICGDHEHAACRSPHVYPDRGRVPARTGRVSVAHLGSIAERLRPVNLAVRIRGYIRGRQRCSCEAAVRRRRSACSWRCSQILSRHDALVRLVPARVKRPPAASSHEALVIACGRSRLPLRRSSLDLLRQHGAQLVGIRVGFAVSGRVLSSHKLGSLPGCCEAWPAWVDGTNGRRRGGNPRLAARARCVSRIRSTLRVARGSPRRRVRGARQGKRLPQWGARAASPDAPRPGAAADAARGWGRGLARVVTWLLLCLRLCVDRGPAGAASCPATRSAR